MEVLNRFTGEVIKEFDIGSRANLREADLRWANLSGADLREANLRDANLSEANLSGANLSGADLSEANLSGANLSGANLSEANLREANLRWVNLSGADLREANLREADLRWANLSGADLREANLRDANLSGADYNNETKWPAPTVLLLAIWQTVSDELCKYLMWYDAVNHPEPDKFDEWVKTDKCPYDDVNVQRCANFRENKKLWQPLPDDRNELKSAYELMQMLFAEKLNFVEDVE